MQACVTIPHDSRFQLSDVNNGFLTTKMYIGLCLDESKHINILWQVTVFALAHSKCLFTIIIAVSAVIDAVMSG